MAIAMSAYTNGRRLFSMRKNKEHIQCLYGLRALALIWLIYGYRHFLSLVLPLINPLDFVLDVSLSHILILMHFQKKSLLLVCNGLFLAMGDKLHIRLRRNSFAQWSYHCICVLQKNGKRRSCQHFKNVHSSLSQGYSLRCRLNLLAINIDAIFE
jgi:hypothetical protein